MANSAFGNDGFSPPMSWHRAVCWAWRWRRSSLDKVTCCM